MASGSGGGSSRSAPSGFAPPHRTPTDSSYYDFHGTPANKSNPNSNWMYARDARSQQAGVPAGTARPYPSYYGNKPPIALSTPPGPVPFPNGNPGRNGWVHHPLIPGQTTTWTSGRPGAVRSVYSPGNTANFDVMYHDPAKGGDFSLATYHPRNTT
ncbi:hypothetical protein BGZ63DRAFT_389910 [Mariannaea sp. PMI_226]|nr:hypothetical protein BGZ63DRAFT_389910 [Mariannaea sp. PMI_226]